jgi:hypothetical protein
LRKNAVNLDVTFDPHALFVGPFLVDDERVLALASVKIVNQRKARIGVGGIGRELERAGFTLNSELTQPF